MTSVATPLGELKGVELDGCERDAGIRYAKAPVGEPRSLPPEPVEPYYPGARHELLNETNRDDVHRDVVDCLDRVTAGR